jgi:acetyl esterase/lipase
VTEPTFLAPFVVKTEARTPERHDTVDLYLPEHSSGADEPAPAIVFVHGGPVPAQTRPTPRDWPVFQGYGSLAASRGVVGVTVDHRLHTPLDYPLAAEDVMAAAELARADPRVDADRIAFWVFSGAGPLLADWVRTPPSWLRCVAASYPLLAPFPGWPVDERFLPVQAIAAAATELPIVLTKVGLENPVIASTVEEFIAAAAGANLEVVDVPDGHHSFDIVDHTEQSRAAVEQALSRVIAAFAT